MAISGEEIIFKEELMNAFSTYQCYSIRSLPDIINQITTFSFDPLANMIISFGINDTKIFFNRICKTKMIYGFLLQKLRITEHEKYADFIL